MQLKDCDSQIALSIVNILNGTYINKLDYFCVICFYSGIRQKVGLLPKLALTLNV